MSDVIAAYEVVSVDLAKAADAIAIGQSIGNPNVRLETETAEMWDLYGAKVRAIDRLDDRRARVEIAYAPVNFTPGSLTHLLTTIMGGQMDIDIIEECRLVDLELPLEILRQYRGPNHGVAGIRKFLGASGRPLIGGIVKPKIGLKPDQLADVCWAMADGGVDFIKEDEILGDVPYCPFEVRIEKVQRVLSPYRVIYAPCVTHPAECLPSVIAALKKAQVNAFHFNVWGGLDLFRYISSQAGLFAFYQKSGDKVITSGKYSIDFSVWCILIRLAGADFTHAGMLGGYLDESEATMTNRLDKLRGAINGFPGTMPSLSCGAHPGLVEKLSELFGNDIMISAGGNLHGHPKGTWAGAKAFRDAAEGRTSPEFDSAILKWGRT